MRLRGFEPLAVDACVAAALAGLGHAGFSGLALVIDANASGLAFVHRGRPLVRTTIPRGGDWIDEQLARKTERLVWDMDGACYVDIDAIVRWKRERAPHLHTPQNDEVQLLAYLYEQLLQELLTAFGADSAAADALQTLRQAYSIVCCGAATMIAGFPQLLAELVQRARLPLTVTELRAPDDGDFAISRGALIEAEIESAPAAWRRAG